MNKTFSVKDPPYNLLITSNVLNLQNRPSLKSRPSNKRKKIGFSPSQQHAKNTDIMLQCDDCEKWQLVFSKKKLTNKMKETLNEFLADVSYTCGFMFGKFQICNSIKLFEAV